jgi:hypothetical protein
MSGIKLKSVPIFPSRVVGGLAIDVEKASGNYTVSVDYANLALVNPYVAQPTDYVLTWDSLADDYFLVPATSLSGSAVSPPLPMTTTTWTPLDLGMAVVACYDFSTPANVIVSGGVLTFATDLSNNQYNLVNGGSPAYNPTGINGVGAASFDGTGGQCLANGSVLLNQANTSQAFTVVCLFQVGSSISSSEEVWGGDINASAQRAAFYINNFGSHPIMYAGTAGVQTGPALSTNTVYLSTVVMKGGASQYSFNGVPLTQGSTTPGFLGLVNGFRLSGNGAMNGLIGYCIVIDGELTTSDLQKLQGYIAAKFGLTTTVLPQGHPYYGVTQGPLVSDLNVPVQIADIPAGSMVYIAGNSAAASTNLDGSKGVIAYGGNIFQQTVYFPYTGEYSFTCPSYYINNVLPAVGNALQVVVDQVPLITQGAASGNYFAHLVNNPPPNQSYTFTGFVTAGFHSVMVRYNYAAFGGQPSSSFYVERILISTTGQPFPAEPAGSRDPTQYPGSSTNLWNLPIGSGAIWSNASDADTITITTSASQRALNCGSFSCPVYIGAGGDPVSTWQDTDSQATPDVSNPGPTRNLSHAPAGMTVAPGSDATIAVIDGGNSRYVYNGFSATVVSQAVAVSRGRWVDLYDDLNPGMGQDLTQYWGLIRTQELLNASINHQLQFGLATQFVQAGTSVITGLAYPASEADFNGSFGGYTGNVLYGSKIGIPKTTSMPNGLSTIGQAFWNCMVNYGAILNITGGQPNPEIIFFAEQSAATLAGSIVTQLNNDFDTIFPYFRILRNHTPSTPNGGGAYLTSLLPGQKRPLLKWAWPTTLNPNDSAATVGNGGYTVTQSLTNTRAITRATPAIGARQIYMEIVINVLDAGSNGVGLAYSSESLSNYVGGSGGQSIGFFSDATVYYNNTNIGNFASAGLIVNDTFCLAIDGINNKVWARKNNGNWNNAAIGSQNPAANLGGFAQLGAIAPALPATYGFQNGAKMTLIQPANQAFTAPAGFVPT